MEKPTLFKRSSGVAAWVAGGLSLAVAALAVLAWSQNLTLENISVYRLFPLFGLLAFSLMWSMYMARAGFRLFDAHGDLGYYYKITGYAVLLAILLHPGLLVFQLWKDGFGLPPQSYLENYVAPTLRWAAMLGTVSFLVFISYELRRVFGRRRWWRFVGYAGDAAIIAIFFHGLALGSQLQQGWFRAVWVFYGLTLVAALLYLYLRPKKPRHG